MSERTFVGANAYRYSFGGQEVDNEVHNNQNNYTAEYWQYDSRLGRRWNVDPIVKPWESSYATFSNNPIYYNDPNGLDPGDPVKPGDGDGTKGTPAPNGGTKKGDGSVVGGEAVCPGCGKNGEDIYGIPAEEKKPDSPELKQNAIPSSGSNSCHNGDHSEMGVGENTIWFSFFITGGGGDEREGMHKPFSAGRNPKAVFQLEIDLTVVKDFITSGDYKKLNARSRTKGLNVFKGIDPKAIIKKESDKTREKERVDFIRELITKTHKPLLNNNPKDAQVPLDMKNVEYTLIMIDSGFANPSDGKSIPYHEKDTLILKTDNTIVKKPFKK